VAADTPVDALLVTLPLECSSQTLYCLNLARGLMDRGARVRVLTGGGPLEDAFRRQEIPLAIHPFIESWIIDWFLLRRLVRELRDEGFGIVHAQSWRKGRIAATLSRRLGVPHIMTVHRYAGPHPHSIDIRELGAVIALSEDLRADLVHRRAVPKDLVHVISPGVATDGATPAPPPFSRAGATPVVGTIAEPDKGDAVKALLAAARDVLAEDPGVQFLVVGETDGGRDRFRPLVRDLGIGSNVVFAPFPGDAMRLLAQFDICVLPSLREGPGQCLLEAMASGRPVIATGEGGAFAVLKDEETGLLVENRDPVVIARAILRLLRNPDLARSMGQRALELVLERFPLERSVDETLSLYKKVRTQESTKR
jgi:glycosyltransferase involved in cell wall biosynthesis